MPIYNGTPGNNNLVGSNLADELYGNGGNDILNGGPGADLLVGGADNDIYIIDATDTLIELPGEGTDEVRAGFSTTLPTNFENLRLTGNGHNQGVGNSANNSLWGNAGNNVLDGAGGSDVMVGGAGNDVYLTDGGDTLTETANHGTDEVRASVSFTLNTNFENLTLTGSANINGSGNAANNVLAGNAGNNVLDGGAGIDTLQMTRAAGSQLLTTADLSAGVATGHGNDQLLNFENVRGTEGGDQITGNAGNNVLDGAGGYNEFFISGGVDSINGGTLGGLRFDFTAAATVNLATGLYQLDATNQGSFSNIAHVVGSPQADHITGNSAVNHLSAGAGDDFMIGGGGDDQMFGGPGSDRLVADAGSDTLVGNSDTLSNASDLAADTFEIRPGAVNVTVADFQIGVDKIDLTAFGFNAAGISSSWTGSSNYSGANANLVLTGQTGQVVNIKLQGVTQNEGFSMADLIGGSPSLVPAAAAYPVNGGNGVADIFVIDPQDILTHHNGVLDIVGFEDGLDRIDLTAFNLTNPTYWDGWVYDYGNNDQTRMEFFGLGNEFVAVNLVGHNYAQVDMGDFIL